MCKAVILKGAPSFLVFVDRGKERTQRKPESPLYCQFSQALLSPSMASTLVAEDSLVLILSPPDLTPLAAPASLVPHRLYSRPRTVQIR
jgi:hypothetical protein